MEIACLDHGYPDDDGLCVNCGYPVNGPPPMRPRTKRKNSAKPKAPKKDAAKPSTKKVTRKLKKDAVPGGRGRRGEGEDLATYVTTVLSKTKTGLKLVDIVKKVIDMGYKTQSDNLSQAVYNVLSKLKKEGRVTKNEANLYFLVGATTDLQGEGHE